MEDMEFVKAMLTKMNATEEPMERQIGSLVSIMKAKRKKLTDEMNQEIRARNNRNTVCFSISQSGWLEKTVAGRPRNEQDHGFEGKS
jgi:hypothetical protein